MSSKNPEAIRPIMIGPNIKAVIHTPITFVTKIAAKKIGIYIVRQMWNTGFLPYKSPSLGIKITPRATPTKAKVPIIEIALLGFGAHSILH